LLMPRALVVSSSLIFTNKTLNTPSKLQYWSILLGVVVSQYKVLLVDYGVAA
jgi:hypothetical protein